MDLGLAGKVAVVAGSTGGLGRAIAEALGREGAHVVVSGRRGDTAREVAGSLPSAIGVEVDLLDPDGPERLIEAAGDVIDILVLNGPGPPATRAADVTAPDAAGAFAALFGVQHQLITRTLPQMRRRGWGRILAVGSSGIAAPLPRLALSNLGRAALAAYLKTLAGEVAADGVTVNLLLPGRIDTDRVTALDAAAAQRENITVDQVRSRSMATIPIGRYGKPAEFAAAAAFLCSTGAGYITGTALRVDGGLVPVL